MRQSFVRHINSDCVDCLFKKDIEQWLNFHFFHTLNAHYSNEVDKKNCAHRKDATSILFVDVDKNFLMQISSFHSLESRFVRSAIGLCTHACVTFDVGRDEEYWFMGNNNHSDSNKSLMGGFKR